MNDIDQKKLLEILRLARSSLNEELMQRQHEAYQAWNVSCQEAWRANGMLLPPYRIKVIYPTEQDIVKKALEIYNTLTPAAVAETAQTPPAATEPMPANVIPPAAVDIEKPVVDAIATPTNKTEIEESSTATQDIAQIESVETTENKFKSLLTKWGGRGTF